MVEDVDQGPARNGQDGEAAELRRLKDSAKFGMYIAASAARRGVTGAEAELNAALGIPELVFRWTSWEHRSNAQLSRETHRKIKEHGLTACFTIAPPCGWESPSLP